MSKLYVFGIGGTGSRVVRSLTMLLASGVNCNDDIVPIFIDPDTSNGDLQRTIGLMKTYNSIRSKLAFNAQAKNTFFKTDIKETTTNFCLPLNNTKDVDFRTFMNLNTMSKENKAFLNLLFSQENLDSKMDVGFKGNPNIGSVVLNQFSSSQEFLDFANNFQQGDKIFIISSIFGGTGASGFPLLLKTLRTNKTVPNFKLINDAPIGAITIMPYFKVMQNDESAIDSATFISKTKAALTYYGNGVTGNNSIDTLYYVGSEIQDTYSNNEGASEQKNKAHIVEMIAALAILDFSRTANVQYDPQGNRMQNTNAKEFGIDNMPNTNVLCLKDLSVDTRNYIVKQMTGLYLFSRYLEKYDKSHCLKTAWSKSLDLKDEFFSSPEYRDLKDFLCYCPQNENDTKASYKSWFNELKANNPKFEPFNWEEPTLEKSIHGYEASTGFFSSKSFEKLESELDSVKRSNAFSPWQEFFEIFYQGTMKFTTKFNF